MQRRIVASSCKKHWNNHISERNISHLRRPNVIGNPCCTIRRGLSDACIDRQYTVSFKIARSFTSHTRIGIDQKTSSNTSFKNLFEELATYAVGNIPVDLTTAARKKFERISPNEAKYASLVWERLLEEQALTKYDVVHIDQLNNILSAFQHTASRQVALQAEKVISSLEKNIEKNATNIRKPTIYTYSLLIDLWAKSPSNDNGERAQKILAKLEKENQANLVVYNTVLSAWSISTHTEAAKYAESLLRSMRPNPDVVSFSCVIKALSEQCKRSLLQQDLNDRNSGGKRVPSQEAIDDAWEAAQRANSIYHEMQTKPHGLTADARCLFAVLDAFSSCAMFHDDAASNAQTLLDHALRNGIKTNEKCWELVLWAWAKFAMRSANNGDHEVARNTASVASKLLEDMYNLYGSGNINAPPTASSYAAVIMAYSKAGEAPKAEQILRNTLALPLIEQSLPPSRIPISSQNAVLQSWMETEISRESLEPHPALNLFRFIQSRSQNQSKKSSSIWVTEPDEWSYAIVLKSLAKTGDDQRAQELYDEFVQFITSRPSVANGNVAHATGLAALLEAHCNQGNVQYADEILLKHTLDCSKAFLLNNSCFHTLLNAWAKHGNPIRARTVLHRQKRLYHESFETLVQPDLIGYSIVMWAFAREGNFDSVKDLWEDLLETGLDKKRQEGQFSTRSLTHCFNALLDALCQTRETAKAESLLLENINSYVDTSSYSIVLNSWARQSRPQEAEALLVQLERLHETGGGTVPMPGSYCISAVEHAWSNSAYPDAAERASALLLRRVDDYKKGNDDSRPDTVCFNAAINAWSKSSHPNADQRALELLEIMVDIKCQPDNITFGSVLNTLAKSKRPDRVEWAETLLIQMKELYKLGNAKAKPDTIVYNTLLRVIGHSKEPDRVEKCCSILDQMDNSQEGSTYGVRPNIRTFNSVILCCAYSSGSDTSRHAALHIATEVFSRVRLSGEVNSFTYDSFFKAIAYLARDQERIELLQHAFELCCNDGHLDSLVLQSLERIAPVKELERLIPIGKVVGRHLRLDKLPASWSRNTSSRSRSKKSRGRK